jgi:hypothetical protein
MLNFFHADISEPAVPTTADATQNDKLEFVISEGGTAGTACL